MARIPEAELARLKAEVSVARLVEGCGVELSRQGADLVGRCPFHEDSSPSLVVSPGKNLWHCLGACQAGGGPVDWVMTAQGVSFRHAVELLREASPALGVLAEARVAGAGPVVRSRPGRSSGRLPALVAPDAADGVLVGEVVAHYAAALAGHEAALGFLARRRIDLPEALETFRVGVADRTLGYRLPSSQVQAGRALRTRLRDLGLVKASGHEHFRGCVTFPVVDVAGVVGEVYGRRLDPAVQPRHLYLPGPHRGVWNAAALASTDELIVTESVIDALSLWCAGFRHVTAAYGTSGWTGEHQAAVVEHGIARVLIAFDADPAGDTGAKTLAAELGAVGVECFRVELPRGSDVNEVAVGAMNPTDALGRVLRKAAWMGSGRRLPAARTPPPGRVVVPAVVSLAASSLAASTAPAPDRHPDAEPGPAPVPPADSVSAAGEPEPPAPVVAAGLDSPAHVVPPVEPQPVEPEPGPCR